MSYSVVHFFDDESVEAVPSVWFNDKHCAWPKKPIFIKKFIEIKRVPNNTDFMYLKARELCRGLSKFIIRIIDIYNLLFLMYFLNICVLDFKQNH